MHKEMTMAMLPYNFIKAGSRPDLAYGQSLWTPNSDEWIHYSKPTVTHKNLYFLGTFQLIF